MPPAATAIRSRMPSSPTLPRWAGSTLALPEITFVTPAPSRTRRVQTLAQNGSRAACSHGSVTLFAVRATNRAILPVLWRTPNQEVPPGPPGTGGEAAEHHTGRAPALHHAQQKARVARQPVQPGDDPHGAAGAAGSPRAGELRPIGALAALHLAEVSHHLAPSLGDIGDNGLALCLKAKPGSALPIGRDP